MLVLWIFLIILICLLAFLRFKAQKSQKYYETRGIYYLGDGLVQMIKTYLRGATFMDIFLEQYNEMKANNTKVAGTKDFGLNGLIVADLDLLKKIFVKDFDYFTDRRNFGATKSDLIFRNMLISIQGDQWKALRSKMSPTFTTGKIRRMFRIFEKSSNKLVKYVEQQMKQSGQIDLTEGYSKYTMDVIASAAFGIDSKAFDQPEPSMFEQMGQKTQFKQTASNILKFIIMMMVPKLANILELSVFGKELENFYTGVIKSTIKHRQETGEIREDFIQLMLEAREGHLKIDESELEKFEKDAILKEGSKVNAADILNDDVITSNCVLFILGGFDTTQSLLIFTAYVLAIHTEIQDKLRSEIESVLEENNGEFTYDAIHKMEYLDMVINETLRYYPPSPITNRDCTLDYKIPDTEFTLKKGDPLTIPIIGIHRDEQYYPEPEKFQPERFSAENKAKRNPYAFLPFGHGPRNCIGMRFALTEVKLSIAHLVHKFTIEPSEKTHIPMKYKNTPILKPLGGMWLALNNRK